MSFNWPWSKKHPDDTVKIPMPFVEERTTREYLRGRMSAEPPEPIVAMPENTLDLHSSSWIYVRNYCLKSLEEMRVSNDNPNLDDLSTAILRGRIKMAKEILDLSKPKPTVPEQDADEED